MYSTYKTILSNTDYDYLTKKTAQSSNFVSYNQTSINEVLTKFKGLSANEIMDELFPMDDYNIFISHSRADKEKALTLKKYFEKVYGLKVFVDSEAWNSVFYYLKELNNDVALIEKESDETHQVYRYDAIKRTSSFAYMMLSSALLEVINKSDVFLILNTENYVLENEDGKSETSSPWIFIENQYRRFIKPSMPNWFDARKIKLFESAQIELPKFDMDISTVKELGLTELKQVENMNQYVEPMKNLYDVMNRK